MTDTVKPFIKVASPHTQNAINLLESWLKEAKAGNVISVGIVGKRTGGEWATAMSSSDNGLEDAAMLIELGIRRMGFVQR